MLQQNGNGSMTKSLAIRRKKTIHISTVVAIMLATIVATMYLHFVSARVYAATPLLIGTEWLGGKGVNVCNPGGDSTCGGEASIGIQGQCVELAQRLYNKLGWHVGKFNIWSAKEIYHEANNLGMTRQANGSITSLQPGDLIIHDGDAPYTGGHGHVAIIDSVDTNGIVRAVHQNTNSNNVRTTYNYSSDTISKPGSGTILGVVQHPKNDLLATASTSRILIRSTNGLYLKDGVINAGWTQITNSQPYEVSPNRIAVYGNGVLSVKEGDAHAPWTQISGNIDEFHITDNRIGIRIGSQLHVKEGGVSAPWVHVAGGVKSFALSSSRIAIYNGNTLSVKEGPLNAAWTPVTGKVSSYDITNNRVGFMASGQLHVKEGALNAPWVHVGGGESFALSSKRLAIYGNSRLVVKDGNLNAPWTHVTDQVSSYDITNNRVGFMASGQLHVKEGALNAPWVHVGGGESFSFE